MHSFIAECIRSAHSLKKGDCNHVFSRVWEKWRRLLAADGRTRVFLWDDNVPKHWQEELTAAEAVISLALDYRRQIPQEWISVLLFALEIQMYYNLLMP